MDPNEYLVECLVKERLAEARAAAARNTLARSLPPRRPARVALGSTLIRIGHWIVGRGAGGTVELSPLARSDGSSGRG